MRFACPRRCQGPRSASRVARHGTAAAKLASRTCGTPNARHMLRVAQGQVDLHVPLQIHARPLGSAPQTHLYLAGQLQVPQRIKHLHHIGVLARWKRGGWAVAPERAGCWMGGCASVERAMQGALAPAAVAAAGACARSSPGLACVHGALHRCCARRATHWRGRTLREAAGRGSSCCHPHAA